MALELKEILRPSGNIETAKCIYNQPQKISICFVTAFCYDASQRMCPGSSAAAAMHGKTA
jgi:hypothetical protein